MNESYRKPEHLTDKLIKIEDLKEKIEQEKRSLLLLGIELTERIEALNIDKTDKIILELYYIVGLTPKQIIKRVGTYPIKKTIKAGTNEFNAVEFLKSLEG